MASGRRAVRNLGGGSTFEVYQAWDERRLCFVACKLIRPDQLGDGRALRLLRREAGLLERLAHPAIVRGLAFDLDGPRPHIVMEHIGKLTLRARIRRRGALPLERAVPVALHLGAALHYLAAEGIVHLDVKPANVLLGIPPRLIDLSIARPVERARNIRRHVGTTSYMAPEQCMPGARGAIGTAADVWGLGVTLYEALTGRLPYPRGAEDAATPELRHPQIANDANPLPEGFPPALASLVAQCLAPDPAARPTAAQVVAALEPLAAAMAPALVSSARDPSPRPL